MVRPVPNFPAHDLWRFLDLRTAVHPYVEPEQNHADREGWLDAARGEGVAG
jgi:hypothetical protein